MAITYPLDLPILRKANQCTFLPSYTQAEAPTRGGGQQVVNIAPDRWQMSYEFRLATADAKKLLAELQSLRGGMRLFKAFDPVSRLARKYPDGYGAWSGTATITSVGTTLDTITLSGLPTGFEVEPGDMVSIGYPNGARALLKAVEAATASGLGAITLTVEPSIRPGWLTTAGAATLLDPWCRAVLDPRSVSAKWNVTKTVCDIRFSAVEVI